MPPFSPQKAGETRQFRKTAPRRAAMTLAAALAICRSMLIGGSAMTACIVGWAHSRFGKLEGEDLEALIGRVARAAIEDAGMAPGDIDEIFVAISNGGFVRQDFPSSLVLNIDPALRFKPATRVENACATGSAAGPPGPEAVAAERGGRRRGGGAE